MATAAQRTPDMIALDGAPAADAFGAVAAGGPIADLQRTLEQRLLAAAPAPAKAGGFDVAHRLSRLAGPVALITAYVGCGFWLF